MKKFTIRTAKKIGNNMGVDWSKTDLTQLYLGMNAELEHAKSLGTMSAETMAKIALDHLEEDPKYYTHLAKMEGKYKR